MTRGMAASHYTDGMALAVRDFRSPRGSRKLCLAHRSMRRAASMREKCARLGATKTLRQQKRLVSLTSGFSTARDRRTENGARGITMAVRARYEGACAVDKSQGAILELTCTTTATSRQRRARRPAPSLSPDPKLNARATNSAQHSEGALPSFRNWRPRARPPRHPARPRDRRS